MADMMHEGDITQAIPWAYMKSALHGSELLIYDADGMGAPVMKLTLDSHKSSHLTVVPVYGSGDVKEKKKRYGEDSRYPDKTLKTNEDSFVNFRAQAATWLRDRFENSYNIRKQIETGGVVMGLNTDNIISIDTSSCVRHFELVAELSRPKRIYSRNGKIGVESKPEMKKRGVQSPNLFDACMMAFALVVPVRKKSHRNTARSIRMRDRGVGM